MFHMTQRRDTPLEFDRDVDSGRKRTEEWSRTPTERAAKSFEKAFGIAYVQALMQNPSNLASN